MLELLKDYKLHLTVLGISIVSELLGLQRFVVGPATIMLIPFVYAFVFGVILTPTITEKFFKGFKKVIDSKEQIAAKPLITMGITIFIAKLAVGVGASMEQIIQGGPAMILQEFGNLGTILITVPVAVLLLRMGRETIGAAFSVTREPSLALASEKWGLDSQVGIGTMGTYIVGTVIGALFFSIMGSIFVSLNLFHPYALAMATGVGSASMMAASATTVSALVSPEQAEIVMSYAAASNLLTTASGLYMSIYMGIPLAKWMYKKLSGDNLEDLVERRV